MKFIGNSLKYGDKLSGTLLSSRPDSIFLIEFGASLPKEISPDNVIVLTHDQDGTSTIPYLFKTKIKHAIDTRRSDYEAEIKLAADMILHPERFVSSPIEQICGEKARPQIQVGFGASDQKRDVISQFDKYLAQVPGTGSVKIAILNMVDELFTNALYDAPTDEQGNQIFLKRDRKLRVEIEHDVPPYIFFFHKDHQGIIGCHDPYGSLDLNKLIERLSELYSAKMVEVKMGHGGAGVGYRMMLENGHGLYVAVQKKQATIVCFTILLGEGLKRSIAYPKNFHFSSY